MAFKIVEGDLEPDMDLTATVNGLAYPLTGATSIQMRWLKPNGVKTTVTLTTVDLSLGQVKRVWAAGDTDVTGIHYGQIVVTWPNTETQSFPSDGTFHVWWVTPKLLSLTLP